MKERFRGLTPGVLAEIQERCRRAPGVESCGLLLARPGSATISSCAPYPGPLRAREFRLSEEWLLQAFLGARSQNLEVAGFYHSHPPSESLVPSAADRSGHPPDSLVLLVGEMEWRAYRSGETWRRLDLTLLAAEELIHPCKGLSQGDGIASLSQSFEAAD